eukprot:987719-Rhodomonas_salina.3
MQRLESLDERCGLLPVGKVFAPVGYGFAFGLDSPGFIPFSQVGWTCCFEYRKGLRKQRVLLKPCAV